MSDNIIFHVWRQDRDGLNKLACAILNAPAMAEVMRGRDVDDPLFFAGAMLSDCEADTWASSTIDKDTAYTWLSDALLFFCTDYPEQVQIGIDRVKAGTDKDTPSLASGLAFVVKSLPI